MHTKCVKLRITQQGMTMIEMLVVTAIIAGLILLVALSMPTLVVRSWDAKRKDDLQKLKNAFEHYYQDTGCYPDPSIVSDCSSTALDPYLKVMLCDPTTNQPYQYYRSGCNTYRLFTTLEYTADPSIDQIGCREGCGDDLNSDGVIDGNYGVGSSNAPLAGQVPSCDQAGLPFCTYGGEGGCCPSGTFCDQGGGWCAYQEE